MTNVALDAAYLCRPSARLHVDAVHLEHVCLYKVFVAQFFVANLTVAACSALRRSAVASSTSTTVQQQRRRRSGRSFITAAAATTEKKKGRWRMIRLRMLLLRHRLNAVSCEAVIVLQVHLEEKGCKKVFVVAHGADRRGRRRQSGRRQGLLLLFRWGWRR